MQGDDLTGVVDDPTKPFKKLQKAIDEVHNRLFDAGVATWQTTDPDGWGQGIVYAMPGLYGSHIGAGGQQYGSGDNLPIIMRDRVHVQGVGARRCELRGNGSGGGDQAFRPCAPWPGTPPDPLYNFYHPGAEVLVSYAFAHQFTQWDHPTSGQFIDLPWV